MAQYFDEFCDLTSNHEDFPQEIQNFEMTIYYAAWLAQYVHAHAMCVDIAHSLFMYVKVCVECMYGIGS